MKALVIAFAVLSAVAQAGGLKQFSATFMLPGYCAAGSREDYGALGGYGQSSNAPKKLSDLPHGSAGEISLIALPSERIPFDKDYRGFRLLLINRTKTEVAFSASDSRLPIICEAFDDNQWRPIEYLPPSFCGNSYHQVYLPSGHYWEFAAPAYSGATKTRLRFKLQSKPPIYSNEFEGSVSTIQFISPPPPK